MRSVHAVIRSGWTSGDRLPVFVITEVSRLTVFVITEVSRLTVCVTTEVSRLTVFVITEVSRLTVCVTTEVSRLTVFVITEVSRLTVFVITEVSMLTVFVITEVSRLTVLQADRHSASTDVRRQDSCFAGGGMGVGSKGNSQETCTPVTFQTGMHCFGVRSVCILFGMCVCLKNISMCFI